MVASNPPLLFLVWMHKVLAFIFESVSASCGHLSESFLSKFNAVEKVHFSFFMLAFTTCEYLGMDGVLPALYQIRSNEVDSNLGQI